MANFDDLVVSGTIECGNLTVSALISQGRAELTQQTPVSLITGANNNVALPGFNGVGYQCFKLAGVSGTILNGITSDTPATLSIQDGQVITLVNVGTNGIDIAGAAGGSAVGNRFAASTQIPAGCCQDYVRQTVGGVSAWYPKYSIATS